mmetsp:Transcript_61317/g.150082  ORF Transcript_61317/g.150082 Transcript_61317/m.150082 type:complete len:92 (-) Transcript_61317:542-817(-)
MFVLRTTISPSSVGLVDRKYFLQQKDLIITTKSDRCPTRHTCLIETHRGISTFARLLAHHAGHKSSHEQEPPPPPPSPPRFYVFGISNHIP